MCTLRAWVKATTSKPKTQGIPKPPLAPGERMVGGKAQLEAPESGLTLGAAAWLLTCAKCSWAVVQLLSRVRLFVTPWTAVHGASLSFTISQRRSNSCPSSRPYSPTISSSVVPFCSHLQSFPASEFFQMSQFFTSGAQSIGGSGPALVFPMNIQDWFL